MGLTRPSDAASLHPAPVATADAAWESHWTGTYLVEGDFRTDHCRMETPAEHREHRLFTEGYRAAIRGTTETLDAATLALALSEYEDGDTRRPSARLMARLLADAERLAAIYDRLAALRGQPSETPAAGDGEAGS